jgi:hypothetical protein
MGNQAQWDEKKAEKALVEQRSSSSIKIWCNPLEHA